MRYFLRLPAAAPGRGGRVLDGQHRLTHRLTPGSGAHRGGLHIKDPQGRSVATIERVPVAVGPLYEIHRPGLPDVTVIQKLFTFQNPKFIIDVPGMDDIEARGDFAAPDYTFYRGGRAVGSVRERQTRRGPLVQVELEESEDQPLLLAAVLVIALALAKGA